MLNREKMHKLLDLVLDAKEKTITNPCDPCIMLAFSSDKSDTKFFLSENVHPSKSLTDRPMPKHYDVNMLIKNELDIDIAIGVISAIVSQSSTQGERHDRT